MWVTFWVSLRCRCLSVNFAKQSIWEQLLVNNIFGDNNQLKRRSWKYFFSSPKVAKDHRKMWGCLIIIEILRSIIKRQTSGTLSANEWQRMATSGTTSDKKWQRVTTSGTTSDNEWQQVTTNDNEWYNDWQRVTANDNEWQRVVQRVTTSDTTSDNEWQ